MHLWVSLIVFWSFSNISQLCFSTHLVLFMCQWICSRVDGMHQEYVNFLIWLIDFSHSHFISWVCLFLEDIYCNLWSSYLRDCLDDRSLIFSCICFCSLLGGILSIWCMIQLSFLRLRAENRALLSRIITKLLSFSVLRSFHHKLLKDDRVITTVRDQYVWLLRLIQLFTTPESQLWNRFLVFSAIKIVHNLIESLWIVEILLTRCKMAISSFLLLIISVSSF